MDKTSILVHVRRSILLSVLIGLMIAGVYFAKESYNSNYTQAVRVSYVYPGIGSGEYPDGERFMMYDFLDNQRVGDALKAMQDRGWYKNISVTQLQKTLGITPYLADPVQDKVSAQRATGSNFTYYSNEYMLYFKQKNPLTIRDSSNMFGLLSKDHSEEFLNELLRINMQYFSTNHTDDGTAFSNLATIGDISGYDYSDIVTHYNEKAVACLDYLYERDKEGKAYRAEATGKTFKDLINSYKALLDIELNRLSSYIESSHLTNQLSQLINRYEGKIEKENLSMAKSSDEATLAESAMMGYDHTFTENMVIVAVNEKDGLYQARPKTAYDTVTQQTMTAKTTADSSGEFIAKAEEDLAAYKEATAINPTEYSRMTKVADEMIEAFILKYNELTSITAKTVNEYLQYSNSGYFRSKIEQEYGQITLSTYAKVGVVFVICSALTLAVLVAACYAMQYRKMGGTNVDKKVFYKPKKPKAKEGGVSA